MRDDQGRKDEVLCQHGLAGASPRPEVRERTARRGVRTPKTSTPTSAGG